MHLHTPKLTAVDPRGLPIRSVNYWRAIEGVAVEPRIERTCRDAAGRPVQEWDARLWALQAGDSGTPPNQDIVYSLSAMALCTVSVDAGTQFNLYGPGGERRSSFDSRETMVEIQYDPSLRPVAVFEQDVGQPRGCVERFTYGAPGVGDQQRNQYGQLIDHYDPAGHVRFNAFALGGQCTENIRRFTRDPLTPDWPQLPSEREKLLETPPGATTTWLYGALGDVLEQKDARGNRQSFDQTVDGRLRESRLQPHGQPEKTVVSAIEYNARGNVERETAGNGLQTILTYGSADGRLQSCRVNRSGGELLEHLSYTYDRMGNVLSIEDKAQPIRYFANQRVDPVSRFAYDSLYQLIKASGREAGSVSQGPQSIGRADPAAMGNYQQTFGYDKSGNVLSLVHVGPQSHGRKLQAARYSNHCLPWDNGVPPSEAQIAAAFDARGNLLELDRGRVLDWNSRNQLRSVSPVERTGGLNDSETYLYDGAGQRVRKLRSLHTNARAVTAEVRYLPAGLQLRNDTGTGESYQVINVEGGLNSVRVLVWDSPPPAKNHQYRYCRTDHLGSVSLETAEDGAIISRETFHPFGETASQDGDPGYKFVRYSGKERDATGLDYYGFRYYVPWLQRWLNPDPAGAIDGLNLYKMVMNNPVSLVDSNGLQTGPTQTIGSVSRLRGLFSGANAPASPSPVRPAIRRNPAVIALASRSQPVTVPPPVQVTAPATVREVVSSGSSRPVDMPDLTSPVGPLPPYATSRMTIGHVSLMMGSTGGVIVMRSDNRSPDDIRSAGGFFPKERRGDYKQNFRTDITTQGWSGNARSHVGFSNPRYVSTGIDDNAGGYAGQRGYLYRMEIPGLEERAINDSTLGLAASMSVKPKSRLDTRLLMNKATLDEADFVAMIPGGTAEMTFISPIPSAFIVGYSAEGTGPWKQFH